MIEPVQNNNKKSRGWIFVINSKHNFNISMEFWEDFQIKNDQVECWIAQFEKGGNTQRKHIQGYVLCKHAVSMNWMKNMLECDWAHLEPARGSREQNRIYCSKEETRIDDTIPKEGGNWATEQGKRNDLLDVACEIKEKKRKFHEIAIDHPTTYMKYHKGMEKLFSVVQNQELNGREGNYGEWSLAKWYKGPTQSGKTSRVFQLYGDRVYWKNPMHKWWDGFKPDYHTAICIDDYPRSIPKDGINFNELLRICQPFPFTVEVKGSTLQLGRQTIIVTSNYGLEEIFGLEANFDALKRRFYEKSFQKVIKLEAQFPDPPDTQELIAMDMNKSEIDLTNED